jgi:hypothetical protein
MWLTATKSGHFRSRNCLMIGQAAVMAGIKWRLSNCKYNVKVSFQAWLRNWCPDGFTVENVILE